MGTSSSYGGPSGKNPLLPPWASAPPGQPTSPSPVQPPPTNQDGSNPDQAVQNSSAGQVQTQPSVAPLGVLIPSISWRGPKGIVSRMANGGGGSWRSASRSYNRAHGGSGASARSASAGRATTSRLGGFLTDVVSRGVTEAARTLGLSDLVGRDAQSLLAAFIDILAPAGALLEEAVARMALIETLSELFDRFDVESKGISALDALDANGVKEVVILSVTNYVNERFQQELVNCIERGTVSEQDANQMMNEAKDFITGIVEIDLETVDVMNFDWNGSEGKAFVESVFQSAYSLLGEEI
jgi:hypothetical protein